MGAIVVVVAGFFLVFAYSTSRIKTNGGSLYTARFDRVDGLKIGSDVRMSGVKIGTVTSIIIDPKTFFADIQFSATESLKLPQDSSAEVISDGLLGGKYLALVPGGDENILKPGDAVVHTQSSVSLEAMIGQLIFNNKSDSSTAKKNEEKKNSPPPSQHPHEGPSPS